MNFCIRFTIHTISRGWDLSEWERFLSHPVLLCGSGSSLTCFKFSLLAKDHPVSLVDFRRIHHKGHELGLK